MAALLKFMTLKFSPNQMYLTNLSCRVSLLDARNPFRSNGQPVTYSIVFAYIYLSSLQDQFSYMHHLTR